MLRQTLLFCFALLTLDGSAFAAGRDISATAEKRVALVIGNAAYPTAPLKNPVNDARAMAATLRAQGFDVVARENASKAVMEKAIIEFGQKLSDGAVGLVYYSGHGLQVSGRNYLIPVDAEISTERMVPLATIDADNILTQMMDARSRVNIVILDACRNNPYERKFRTLGGGLAQMNAPQGTMIAYATAPGKTASDGVGTNGLYTQELLKAMRLPGVKVEEVFKQVRVAVGTASNNEQVPWEASSLTGDFYFAGMPTVTVPAQNAAPAFDPRALELAFWDAIKASSDAADYKAYLDQYPNGQFAPLARSRAVAKTSPPVVMPPAPQPTINSQEAALGSYEMSLVGVWENYCACQGHSATDKLTILEARGGGLKTTGGICTLKARSGKFDNNKITIAGYFLITESLFEGSLTAPGKIEGTYPGRGCKWSATKVGP